ncbi:MAG: hypothetical protein QOH69_970 [Actinomycetota bacterium]|jgi:hypothetical protein|nr:hypothetical protein [Actinomycetota bacterium]
MIAFPKRILAPVILAGAVVFVLTACAPPHHPGGSSSHHPGHSASATPTPTPAATRPAIGDLILSTSGLGPLHLGSPVPTTPAPLALMVWNPTACVSADLGISAGDPNAGAWHTTFPDADGPAGTREPFILTTVGSAQTGNVNLVWVWSDGPHTAAGIHVGSTLEQLHSAYPDFARTVTGGVSDVYVIDGPTGSLSFEVSRQSTDGGTDYWPADQVNKVLWMGAEVSDSPYIGPIAASDGGPSGCPSGA